MGEIVKLEDFRKSNELEEEYLKFLTNINKFVKIPTNVPELARCFYFTLRYLEGNINCLEILSLIKNIPEDDIQEMKKQLLMYLDGLVSDLQKL